MSNKLKEITYLTVKNLKSHDIILPGTYSTTFENMAKKLEVDFDKEEVILKDLHQNEQYVHKIVEKTNESLCSLQKTTCDAQKAIEEKNDESLKSINQELAQMQKQIDFLQKELFSDPLTKAYNRKWFSDFYLVDDKFQNSGQMAFIDLNKFKIINDTYGHLVGDQVLKYLVKFLKTELNHPGIDIVRYAGDEFIILFNNNKMPSLNVDQMMKDAQEKLQQQKLKSAKIKELSFGFSYGLTSFNKDQELEYILEIVDELMYKNKQENR